MPASAPQLPPATQSELAALGAHIRNRRQALRVSAAATAAAAGMSRVTLHRIEHGEASVTMGAYLGALSVLGLELGVTQRAKPTPPSGSTVTGLPPSIQLADYPQLRQLAWSIPGASDVTPEEALGLYERGWRLIEPERLSTQERQLIEQLARTLGGGRLLV